MDKGLDKGKNIVCGERKEAKHRASAGFTLPIPAEIRSVPLFYFEEWFVFVCRMTEESVQGCKASVQHLNFLTQVEDFMPRMMDIWSVLALIPARWPDNPRTFRRPHWKCTSPDWAWPCTFQRWSNASLRCSTWRRSEDSSQARRRRSEDSTFMVCLISSLKTLLTIDWKISPTLFSPKTITL